MTYAFVLAAHIFAACATVAIIGGALFALVKHKAHLYKRIGVALAAIALIQTISGALLVALAPELSALKVGLHLLAYLGVCLFVEGLLVVGARSKQWTS